MARASKQPNVMIFMADELRADALGCYGNPVCQTPNLDALAARGVVFRNGFSPNPICVPARATLTTGNYSHTCTGNKDNGGRIHDDQIKLAEHFVNHGYETYACGKLHYSPYAAPGQPRTLHGFQHWDAAESGRIFAQYNLPLGTRGAEDYMDYLEDVGWGGYSRAHGIGNNDVRPCPTPLPAKHHVDAWVATCTIKRLKEHRKRLGDKPWLMFCSFPKPHAPFDPPYEYVKKYDPREMPKPLGDPSMLVGRNPYHRHLQKTHALDSLSPEARQVIKAYYYALVTHQDAQVGRVMKHLKTTGQLNNTIFVFTADHGEMLGDFGTYFKASFLNGSVMVPLIVAAPGIKGGAVRQQLVGLQDVLPTVAALAGCPLPKKVHGVDLTAALSDPKAKVRDIYYSQTLGRDQQMAMVCDGQWKYCYAQEGATEELYNLVDDPNELVNLAQGRNAESLLKPWRAKMIAEIKRFGDSTMLDAQGNLVKSPFDPASLEKLHVHGMGWRWY